MSSENVSAEPEIGRAHGIDGRAASIGHLQSPKMAAEPENGRAHGIDGRAASIGHLQSPKMAEHMASRVEPPLTWQRPIDALPCFGLCHVLCPKMAEHMAEPENVEYVRLT